MMDMDGLFERIKKVFTEVQRTKSCHQKYLASLHKEYQKANYTNFRNLFWTCLDYIFHTDLNRIMLKQRNVIEFAANFCIRTATSNKDMSLDEELLKFFTYIIKKVLTMYNCSFPQVRYCMCLFFNVLLNNITDGYLDDNLCNNIQNKLLENLNDKNHIVRLEAVRALVKLQNIHIPNCPVIDAFTSQLGDNISSVRKEVIKYIAPSKKSLPYIAMKVRDLNKYVKIAAYEKCASINPKHLGIMDRQSILWSGFQEEEEDVKKRFVNQMLPDWISKYDDDFLKFLNALHLNRSDNDEMEYLVKNLMKIVFKKYSMDDILMVLPLDNNKIVKYENLSINAVNFWNMVICHLKELDDTANLEKVVPDVTEICNIIEIFVEKDLKNCGILEHMEKERVLKCLCETMTCCDLVEEAGRQNVNRVLLNLLYKVNLNQNVVDHIIEILVSINDTMESLILKIFNLITNLQTNIEAADSITLSEDIKYELSKLFCKFARLENEQEEAIKEKNYELANKLAEELKVTKEQIDMRKNNTKTTPKDLKIKSLLKSLIILNGLLKLEGLKTVPKQINDFKEKYLPILLNEKKDPTLYTSMLQFMILCAIMDKENITLYLKHITTPLMEFDCGIQYDRDALLVSISGVNDLLLVHGPNIFVSQESSLQSSRILYQEKDDIHLPEFDKITSNYVIEIFTDLLDNEDDEISRCAGMSILKLIVNNKGVSFNLLTRIILKWFNPVSELEDSLHQYMGISLVNYVDNVTNSNTFEECVIPTFKAIAIAPKHSPLADIDVTKLIEFMILMIMKLGKRNPMVSSNLVTRILTELLMRPNSEESIYLCKLLLRIDLPCNINNTQPANEIIDFIDKLLSTIRDIPIKPYVEKYRTKLQLNYSLNTNHKDVENEKSSNRETSKLSNDSNLLRNTSCGSNAHEESHVLHNEIPDEIPNQENSDIQSVISDTCESVDGRGGHKKQKFDLDGKNNQCNVRRNSSVLSKLNNKTPNVSYHTHSDSTVSKSAGRINLGRARKKRKPNKTREVDAEQDKDDNQSFSDVSNGCSTTTHNTGRKKQITDQVKQNLIVTDEIANKTTSNRHTGTKSTNDQLTRSQCKTKKLNKSHNNSKRDTDDSQSLVSDSNTLNKSVLNETVENTNNNSITTRSAARYKKRSSDEDNQNSNVSDEMVNETISSLNISTKSTNDKSTHQRKKKRLNKSYNMNREDGKGLNQSNISRSSLFSENASNVSNSTFSNRRSLKQNAAEDDQTVSDEIINETTSNASSSMDLTNSRLTRSQLKKKKLDKSNNKIMQDMGDDITLIISETSSDEMERTSTPRPGTKKLQKSKKKKKNKLTFYGKGATSKSNGNNVQDETRISLRKRQQSRSETSLMSVSSDERRTDMERQGGKRRSKRRKYKL